MHLIHCRIQTKTPVIQESWQSCTEIIMINNNKNTTLFDTNKLCFTNYFLET